MGARITYRTHKGDYKSNVFTRRRLTPYEMKNGEWCETCLEREARIGWIFMEANVGPLRVDAFWGGKNWVMDRYCDECDKVNLDLRNEYTWDPHDEE